MKKIFTLLAVTITSVSFAQKSTGTVVLSGAFTAKVDITATQVKLTIAGPSDRWFAVGFDNDGMNTGDLVAYNGTTLKDLSLVGYVPPTSDTNQDWTIAPGGNTVSGSTRTIIATRALNTGEAGDHVFSLSDTSIKLGWARAGAASYTFGPHNSDGGFTTGSFATLGLDDFASIDKLNVFPNPSPGTFTIFKDNSLKISTVKVFDINAKLIKEITDLKSQNTIVDLSGLTSGTYFMEIANEDDKTVKKIVIK